MIWLKVAGVALGVAAVAVVAGEALGARGYLTWLWPGADERMTPEAAVWQLGRRPVPA